MIFSMQFLREMIRVFFQAGMLCPFGRNFYLNITSNNLVRLYGKEVDGSPRHVKVRDLTEEDWSTRDNERTENVDWPKLITHGNPSRPSCIGAPVTGINISLCGVRTDLRVNQRFISPSILRPDGRISSSVSSSCSNPSTTLLLSSQRSVTGSCFRVPSAATISCNRFNSLSASAHGFERQMLMSGERPLRPSTSSPAIISPTNNTFLTHPNVEMSNFTSASLMPTPSDNHPLLSQTFRPRNTEVSIVATACNANISNVNDCVDASQHDFISGQRGICSVAATASSQSVAMTISLQSPSSCNDSLTCEDVITPSEQNRIAFRFKKVSGVASSSSVVGQQSPLTTSRRNILINDKNDLARNNHTSTSMSIVRPASGLASNLWQMGNIAVFHYFLLHFMLSNN